MASRSIDTLEVNCKHLKPWEAWIVKSSSRFFVDGSIVLLRNSNGEVQLKAEPTQRAVATAMLDSEASSSQGSFYWQSNSFPYSLSQYSLSNSSLSSASQ
ncbi:hypothetical protein WN944_014978 [Citrus x changshan-huyou]|uniref:Uncharacterized protein n=1 Tax=Citrus x changshan-huyou TaxID=2935761 RepID=A0AAP0MD41_9ROSI